MLRKTPRVALRCVTQGSKYKGKNAMTAEVINLSDSRRRRGARKKLRLAKEPEQVTSLCDARRLRQVRKSGESLKGRGYPDDFLVGYDEDPMMGLAEDHWLARFFKEDKGDAD